MASLEKNDLYELELLKHVEETPRLNNRMAAAKLGCSVKLAHALLKKLVARGWLHIRKVHSRRWDYFLTPAGVAQKARLTYEFLDFSFQFYQEARKTSSQLCRDLAEGGCRSVALIGAGDLAEVVYLGVREWGLTLSAVYADEGGSFLDLAVQPLADSSRDEADALIVCLYDRSDPMGPAALPDSVVPDERFRWVFPLVTHAPHGGTP